MLYVIPHKALGLILYLNFAKIIEDIPEQKTRKMLLFLYLQFDTKLCTYFNIQGTLIQSDMFR